MKTIFIYDSCGTETIKFFVKNGDYSHLNNIYVNCVYETKKENAAMKELSDMLFGEDGTQNLIEMTDVFPLNGEECSFKNYHVVTVGFLP